MEKSQTVPVMEQQPEPITVEVSNGVTPQMPQVIVPTEMQEEAKISDVLDSLMKDVQKYFQGSPVYVSYKHDKNEIHIKVKGVR